MSETTMFCIACNAHVFHDTDDRTICMHCDKKELVKAMSENYPSWIYEDENDDEYIKCDGKLKYYLTLGGTIEQCPKCGHWNGIASTNTLVDDMDIDNPKNWSIYCQCCGNESNM